MKVTARPTLLTPGDIRAALARKRIPLYLLAASVRVHPARLSPMIHERAPLPPRIAARIAEALRTWEPVSD